MRITSRQSRTNCGRLKSTDLKGIQERNLTLSFEKSQCSMIISRSAALPSRGRGGYDVSSRPLCCTSKYFRPGAVLFSKAAGERFFQAAGCAGLAIFVRGAKSVGTTFGDFSDRFTRIIFQRTFPPTWMMPTGDFPEPDILQILPLEYQGGRRPNDWPRSLPRHISSPKCTYTHDDKEV